MRSWSASAASACCRASARVGERVALRGRASMRLVEPASTLPGPHSTTCVTPARRHRRIVSTQRTGLRRLAHQRVLDGRRAPVARARRRCCTTGMRGVATVTSARQRGKPLGRRLQQRCSGTARSPAAAPRASRPAPSQRRSPRSTAALWPGDHDLARRVEVDRLRPPSPCAASAHAAAHRVVVQTEDRGHRARPRPAPPPASPARGSAPAAARRAKSSAPAATSAVYSPRLWPATIAGSAPPAARQAR